MKIKRDDIIDQFSTFLFFTGENSYSFRWHTDLKLKKNIHLVTQHKQIESELIAYQFLTNLRQNYQQILSRNHLASYLQETCFWTAKTIYRQCLITFNNLTLEECFLSANQAVIKPEKFLNNYNINGGSKITTYAQIRLKTIVKDTIYHQRHWKVLSNWGLLTKISKSKREKVLTEFGGLTGDKLTEYLIVWQCFCDNYLPSHQGKNRYIYNPTSSQIELMTKQYDLLAKNTLKHPTVLTIEEFKKRLEFCSDNARLFTNPITVSYENHQELTMIETPENYLENYDIQQKNNDVNQILIKSFTSLDLHSQVIIYFGYGLGFTQKEILSLINDNNLNFITQQYQLSKYLTKIRKSLIDSVIKHQNIENKNINLDKDKIKSLISLLEEWLNEYIDSEIQQLFSQSYEKISENQRQRLQENYLQANIEEKEKINLKEVTKNFKEIIEKKFNLKIPSEDWINHHLNIIMEKCFSYYCHQTN